MYTGDILSGVYNEPGGSSDQNWCEYKRLPKVIFYLGQGIQYVVMLYDYP